jgi:hypothetical protein
MIETKEIANAYELAKTFKGMNDIDIKKVFESVVNEAVDSALIDKAIKISDNMNITEFECDYADLLVKTFKADKSKIFSIVASDTEDADFTASQAKVLDTIQDYILKNGKKTKTAEAPEVYVLDKLILINSGMSGESYQMYALKESVVNESCVPGKEYKIKGVAGWIYQGAADGFHIFNNDKGGFDPKNYNDAEFAKAHETGEITECGM